MAFQFPDEVAINTLIGPGSSIHGNLKVNGFIRIDGDLDGNLETPGNVIVGEAARIRGTVRARSVSVGGVIQGDVVAPEGVTILSSGMVLGAVLTRRLLVEEEVLLNGPCVAVNDQARFEEALSEYNNRKAYASATYAASRAAGSL